MTRNPFAVAFRVDLAHSRAAWKPICAIALEDPIDPGIRDRDAVVAFETPNDADRPEMILAPKMQNIVRNLSRGFVRLAARR